MIRQDSIEELRDIVEILKTVERYGVDMKKRGTVYVGCCPFHDENTPSFTVSVKKGIYKCFGCGEGGDAFKFVMKKDKLGFIEAIREIAAAENFTLEETEETPEEKELIKKKADLKQINKAAAQQYHKHLDQLLIMDPVKQELYKKRQLQYDTIVLFEIGYSPDNWQFISPTLVDKGLYYQALELGLIATTNDRNYDVYRDRIMFPIHDAKGEVIGFGGRRIDEKDKENPKYINGKDSSLYKKDTVLYGIFQAQKFIREEGYAVIVEGYYDVASTYQSGVRNVVAACGTAFTTGHAKALKKYTNVALLMFDGDDAGKKATMKTIDILLKEGFKVEVCLLEDGQDPDTLARLYPLEVDELEEED